MKNMKVVQLNVNPEEAEQFATSLAKLLKNADPEQTVIKEEDLPKAEKKTEVFFDDEDCCEDCDINEFFYLGESTGIEEARMIALMSEADRKRIFGNKLYIQILENWEENRAKMQQALLEADFVTGDVVVDRQTGEKYLVKDRDRFFLTVIDSDFKTSQISRFSVKEIDE